MSAYTDKSSNGFHVQYAHEHDSTHQIVYAVFCEFESGMLGLFATLELADKYCLAEVEQSSGHEKGSDEYNKDIIYYKTQYWIVAMEVID